MHIERVSKIKITKHGIQNALGIIWLLDGCLQLQHRMFSSAFATQVVAPAGRGQPIVVHGPINFVTHILLMHPAVYNGTFAIIQLTIGILILNKKSVRFGLLFSVIWGLIIWWLGEGLGGLLSGQTSVLMGAPGAALLYVVLALAVLPQPNTTQPSSKQKPAYWLLFFWALLWVGGAVYQLLPGQNSVSAISSMITNNSGGGSPGWLSSLDIHISNLIAGFGNNSEMATMSMKGMVMSGKQMESLTLQSHHTSGYWFIISLAILQAAIGLLIFLPYSFKKIAISLGIALSIIFWCVGQSLGTYFTGLATDPNSAPLYILLGIAVLGSEQFELKQLKPATKNTLKRFANVASSSPTIKAD